MGSSSFVSNSGLLFVRPAPHTFSVVASWKRFQLSPGDSYNLSALRRSGILLQNRRISQREHEIKFGLWSEGFHWVTCDLTQPDGRRKTTETLILYCNVVDCNRAGWDVDCEQSLFSSDLVRGVHASASVEQQSRERQETRAANDLSNLVPLVTCVVICVSRTFCSTDQEKRETARCVAGMRTGWIVREKL